MVKKMHILISSSVLNRRVRNTAKSDERNEPVMTTVEEAKDHACQHNQCAHKHPSIVDLISTVFYLCQRGKGM